MKVAHVRVIKVRCPVVHCEKTRPGYFRKATLSYAVTKCAFFFHLADSRHRKRRGVYVITMGQ